MAANVQNQECCMKKMATCSWTGCINKVCISKNRLTTGQHLAASERSWSRRSQERAPYLVVPLPLQKFFPSITASQLILAFNMLYINECYIFQFHSIPASMIGRQYQTGCRPEEVHEKYF